MAKAKFKVYSKRTNETTGAIVFGLSAVVPEKGDPQDFGTKHVWGELQINCDPETDAAEEFNVGDIVTLSVDKTSTDDEDEDLTPSAKKSKTGNTSTEPTK